ncbi:uridylate kinase [Striga asiatica]|uniref:Uridylate kinase n=1 Tax=Striga asiatica TaxID=4170 RepID=A0A5A7QX34_STRAF|nr:uridylate kinase [Striga asiatica]
MGWKVRKEGDNGEAPEDCSSSSELFTIRFHHSGMKEVFGFHCSKGGINDCSDLMVLENDSDVLNMVNFLDVNRMLGSPREFTKQIDGANVLVEVGRREFGQQTAAESIETKKPLLISAGQGSAPALWTPAAEIRDTSLCLPLIEVGRSLRLRSRELDGVRKESPSKCDFYVGLRNLLRGRSDSEVGNSTDVREMKSYPSKIKLGLDDRHHILRHSGESQGWYLKDIQTDIGPDFEVRYDGVGPRF